MARARSRRDNERICVLQGQQTPAECRMAAGRCGSRSHTHMTMARCREQVALGMAHWEGNCLKLERARRWKPKMSYDPEAAQGPLMVWQLVA